MFRGRSANLCRQVGRGDGREAARRTCGLGRWESFTVGQCEKMRPRRDRAGGGPQDIQGLPVVRCKEAVNKDLRFYYKVL